MMLTTFIDRGRWSHYAPTSAERAQRCIRPQLLWSTPRWISARHGSLAHGYGRLIKVVDTITRTPHYESSYHMSGAGFIRNGCLAPGLPAAAAARRPA